MYKGIFNKKKTMFGAEIEMERDLPKSVYIREAENGYIFSYNGEDYIAKTLNEAIKMMQDCLKETEESNDKED